MALFSTKREEIWEDNDKQDNCTQETMNLLEARLDQLATRVHHLSSIQGGHVPRSVLKPKDIDLLHLEELSSIDGIASKQSFFRQLEQVACDDRDRVQICLTRLDKDLRLFVESKIQNNPFVTLDQIQSLLDDEFKIPKNLPDSIDRLLNSEIYSLDMDPREFSHRFKVKYGRICSVFQTKGLPDLAKVLKQAMVKGLDMTAKAQLGSVLMEEFDEETFLLRLEALRLGRTLYSQTCNTVQGTVVPPLCKYCKGNSRHLRKDCPRKPQVGSCFDCLGMGHRAGSATCPMSPNL